MMLSERATLKPPARPPRVSWWVTAPREDWQARVEKECERIRGSLGEWDVRTRMIVGHVE